MPLKKIIFLWVVGLLLLILLGPLLEFHFIEVLWSRRYYQWFPILLLILVVLTVIQCRKAKPAETAPLAFWLQVGMLGCMFLTVVAYLYYTGWVACVAAIGVVGLLAASLTRWREVQGLFGIWAMLLFLVRLPHQIEVRLLNLFEIFSAKVASVIIDQSGVYHVVQADFLVIDGYEIDLRMICAGYFSVISVAVFAGLYVLWRKRPTFHALLLIGSAFAIATIVNVLRIATVGIVYAKAGWDVMDSGWMYVMLVVSFGLTLLALLSVDALLHFFLMPAVGDERKREGCGVAKVWNCIVEFRMSKVLTSFRKPIEGEVVKRHPVIAGVLVVSLLGLTAFEAVVLYYRWGFGDYQTYFMHDKENLAIIDPAEVKFTRPGWELIEMEEEDRNVSSIWGAYSFIWRLEYYGTRVVMTLDYPFDKWHDVKRCYSNLGWRVETENLVYFTTDKEEWGASQTEMSLPMGNYGFILCSHCDHEGKPVQPKPTTHQFDMVMYYLHPKQWTAPFGVSVDKNKNTFYQTQVMVNAVFPLDEPTKQEIRDMYGEFRAQTRALIERESKQ